MGALRLTAAAVIVLGLLTPAAAEEHARCLTPEQQRTAIKDGQAVPLAHAIRALRRTPREVVRARLCEQSGKLVYLLTVLARDGKVRRASVDASSGSVLAGER
jgi:uncharacterized membrane protein YkoI